MKPHTSSSGFSLVELAIVLVIMGLIVTGAMTGRELLRTAKLRAAISELETLKLAIDSFETTYEGLPGDLKNATGFFGTNADCAAPYTAGAGTCNGNGDGEIGVADDATDDTEPYTAWDQLATAKMITGAFAGAGTAVTVGTNVPGSTNLEGVGFSLSYFASPWGYTDSIGRGFPSNYITMGKTHATDNYAHTAALIPEDAHFLDGKIDDGNANSGKVLGAAGTGASGTCNTGADYDMNNVGIACALMFAVSNQ